MATRTNSELAPLLYSIPDARALLGGISRGHVYSLVNRGALTAVKIGGRTLITASSVRRVAGLEEQKKAA